MNPTARSLAGAALLALSALLLYSGADWIRPFFYLCAWWSYLLMIGALEARMALLSIPFWLAYEVLNLRLRNWEYWDLPAPAAVRWAGYAAAFATVLPAVLGTARLIERRLPPPAPAADPSASGTARAEKGPRAALAAWRLASLPSFALAAAGALCLALPLLLPGIFFPLAWAFAFLLLEPRLRARAPGRSWLSALERGDARRTIALLLSGALCGLLWESLNFWAGAKWKYTVPWPKGPKLFEMPLLGYLGFPPFALGCASAWECFEESWPRLRPGARAAAALLLAAACLAAFWLIDSRTVHSLV